MTEFCILFLQGLSLYILSRIDKKLDDHDAEIKALQLECSRNHAENFAP